MNSKDVISKGPVKRDPICFQTQHVIIIPKGTILRQQPGGKGGFDCPVAFGTFSIRGMAAEAHPDDYKKVIA